MGYIKQLDSLRAIAVILVIIHHWIPENYLIHKIPNGAIGVDIFFVLSGFLITKILLDNRLKAESKQVSIYSVIKNFYLRRALRIFPIYYIAILFVYLLGDFANTNIREDFIFYLTYTSNFHFFNIQTWDGVVSHLWTLAVEEQFYLIWPWLILMVNKKYLLWVILGFVFIGITGQLLMSGIKLNTILTFNCFDAFGLGGYLAWQITFAKENFERFYKIISILAALFCSYWFLCLILDLPLFLPLRTVVSIITVWLISYLLTNHKNEKLKLKFIFNNKLLIFLGKISYGLYLYHNIIPYVFNTKLINRYFNPLLPDFLYKENLGILFISENIIILIIISWLSYRYIEMPFLKMKHKFQYV